MLCTARAKLRETNRDARCSREQADGDVDDKLRSIEPEKVPGETFSLYDDYKYNNNK